MKSVLKVLGAVMGAAALTSLVACGGSSGSLNAQSFTSTVLVSDGAVAAPHTDANLKNAWGIAFNPKGFVWVADNATSLATLYDGNGVPQSLVVSVPAGASGSANPTGIVFNGTTDFMVTQGGKSGVAAFIFSGEGGNITAWAPAVAPTAAITVFDDGNGGAVYKGLALASNGTANLLYATDFHNNKIDVFDSAFNKLTTSGRFVDPSLPAGFAPFGIQAIGNSLFVAYAKQDSSARRSVHAAGQGVIDVYDMSGALQKRFATGGDLNAPWGITIAPSNFGPFSNKLIVGNFGDGTLHAFDPQTGAAAGALTQRSGAPITIAGLWGIAFGNGLNAQPTNTLFFAAGPNSGSNGAYGRLDVDQ